MMKIGSIFNFLRIR